MIEMIHICRDTFSSMFVGITATAARGRAMRLLSCLCALAFVLGCSLVNQFNSETVATTPPAQETLTVAF